jgi:aldehyde:ferredoxin oxidoreductase
MKPMHRILIIDLSERKSVIEEIPYKVIEKFIGGRGLGAKMLWDYVKPQIDPLGPENKLIFNVGPLQGTGVFFTGRTILCTKSPLTNIYLYSVAGGNFGINLRKCGYSALIIQGKSNFPVFIWIKDNKVEFKEADRFWGMITTEAQQFILDEVGDPEASTAVIGPAGENLSRISGIVTEGSKRRIFARGGSGAVMGSKFLKGIAIRGTGEIEIGDPKSIKRINTMISEALKNNPEYLKRWKAYGTAGDVGLLNELGIFPTRNWQTGFFEKSNDIDPNFHREDWVIKDTTCGSLCPMFCTKVNFIRSGEYAGFLSEGPEYETIYSFGSNCGNNRFDSIIAADRLCDDFGLDTMSTGAVIGFAMECFEKGLIGEKETDGLMLRFGNHKEIVNMIRKIAYRQGFGDVLAEGVRKVSEQIGKGSDFFAIHSKGLEFGGYECRGVYGQALQYAMSNRGGCHHDLGNPARIEIRDGSGLETKNKGKLLKEAMISRVMCDIGILCTFPRHVLGLALVANALSAAIGETITEQGLREICERIVAIERAFNVREGIRAKDDRLPDRLLKEPMPDGPTKGSRVPFEALKEDFYREFGWNSETGAPTKETLERLGLNDVAEELKS